MNKNLKFIVPNNNFNLELSYNEFYDVQHHPVMKHHISSLIDLIKEFSLPISAWEFIATSHGIIFTAEITDESTKLIHPTGRITKSYFDFFSTLKCFRYIKAENNLIEFALTFSTNLDSVKPEPFFDHSEFILNFES